MVSIARKNKPGANHTLKSYTGRFAPSPTGDLHFGSLVAAVGSYAQALVHQGRWLLRIEDIDPAREVPGAAQRQIEDLGRFGLISPAAVEFQSRRRARHEQVIDDWLKRGLAFECGCSRSDLPDSGIYPGTCRNGLPTGRSARSVRFRVPDREIEFHDAIHGRQRENLSQSTGDFVIRRADGLIAYQLAVVVDDVDDGITEVVRGADLLSSTARQIVLWQALQATPPMWVHLPLIVDATGHKLSKSTDADPVRSQPALQALKRALGVLGHKVPDSVDTVSGVWDWVRGHWCIDNVGEGPVRLDG